MKYLIVGLGNIGSEYADTRHNAGFRIADALVEGADAKFSTERYGDIARMRVKNAQLIVLKPSTYMNLSGNAVRYWKEKEGIEIENILVLVDDCALPFGAIRIKPRGSDAGHNGLKNIARVLGTQDYVLGQFTPEEEKLMPERIKLAVEAIKTFCLAGIQTAMNSYNNK